MKKYSLGALVAAGLLVGGLSAGSASAADLGGNCCADLEERIAELEATTVRKGNRKVSLTLSGWVAEQVMWFDDGTEQNVYVSGIGRTLQSHFKLTGQATISPGWYAGYVIHIEVGTAHPFGLTAANDDPLPFADAGSGLEGLVKDTERGVYTLQSFWFVKSDNLGKVSIGKQSQASDNTAILVDGSGSLVAANWVLFDGLGLGGHSNLAFCHSIGDQIGGDCNGITGNFVRYDSPVFGGFSVSASWGEDDIWDVAARYAGEWNGIKVAAAAAYSEVTDENWGVTSNFWGGNCSSPCDSLTGATPRDVAYFQIGAYVEHVPTGLWVYGAYGREDVSMSYGGFAVTQDPDHWYVKAGLRERWSPLGHTVLFGEYGKHNDQFNPFLLQEGVVGSDFNRWGAGIVQEIDAAAMSIWLVWRHHEGDYDCGAVIGDVGVTGGSSCTTANTNVDLEDVDMVKFGGLINF